MWILFSKARRKYYEFVCGWYNKPEIESLLLALNTVNYFSAAELKEVYDGKNVKGVYLTEYKPRFPETVSKPNKIVEEDIE